MVLSKITLINAIQVTGAELSKSRSLAGTEITIKMKGRILASYPYGDEVTL